MKYRTIIIDDDVTIRELLRMAGQVSGYEVFTYQGPTFCPLVTDHPCPSSSICCDFMISDQNMPDMSGLEFYELLTKKGCKLKNRAIVTADCSMSVQKKAKELSSFFIAKPFTLKQILKWFADCEFGVPEDRKLTPVECLLFKR